MAALDPNNVPLSSPTIEVLTALRKYLAAGLGLPDRLVGGWEVIAERNATLAVYSNGGSIQRGAGSMVTREDEEVTIVFMIRSGSPIQEKLLYPVRDAIAHLLARFTHPLLAGVGGMSWTFDLRKDSTFSNILTVKTSLKHRSGPAHLIQSDAGILGTARSVVAELIHIPHDREE